MAELTTQKITSFFWFDSQAEEAMNFYVDVFGGKIVSIERYAGGMGIPGEAELKGKVLTGVFELAGQTFMCLDGGPQFKPGGNISLYVACKDQAEIDAIWEKLMDGGTPMQCGWITDKFGTTWQITGKEMDALMVSPDATPAQKKAMFGAMMPMVKIDLGKLKEAFEGAAKK